MKAGSLTLMAVSILVAITAETSSAQTYVTSPKGYLNQEGNNWFYIIPRRMQAIDATHVGSDMTIKSLALRRNNVSPASVAQPVYAELKVGINANIHHITDNMAQNFVIPPTTVFKGSIMWPNWQAAGTGPFPFDAVFPFTPSYMYPGKRRVNLVWDLDLSNNLFFKRYTDSAGLASTNWKPSVAYLAGNGCTGFSNQTRFSNNGASAVRTGLWMTAAAYAFVSQRPQNPVFMALSWKQTTITVPAWCGPIHVQPTILMPIGPFTRTSTYPSYTMHATVTHLFSAPYTKSIEGMSFYTQMVTTNQNGIWLSNALKSTIQQQPALGAPDGFAFLSTPNTYPFMGSGMIARLGL